MLHQDVNVWEFSLKRLFHFSLVFPKIESNEDQTNLRSTTLPNILVVRKNHSNIGM